MSDVGTKRARSKFIWFVVGFIVIAMLAALFIGRASASDKKQLVGRWTTQLTGYSTSASGATKYEQTVYLKDDGTVVVQFDLGGMEPVNGTWELDRDTENGKIIRITWADDSTKVNEFKYQLKGNELYLSRVQGGMPKPENLNVTEQDPVVYERGPMPE
jgi:hypothetical protein